MSYLDQITVGSTTYDIKDSNAVTDVQAYGTSVVSNGVAALPDTIHIGTAAPSDPNVKIWLDTDETSDPIVTSVNGQTGAITAVNSINGQNGVVILPMISMTLLWTNSSPTSSFTAQTVELDLSNYQMIMIWFKPSTDSSVLVWSFGYVGFDSRLITMVNWRQYRAYTITTTGITFNAGSEASQTNNVADDNTKAIPLYIYGIKGVVNT